MKHASIIIIFALVALLQSGCNADTGRKMILQQCEKLGDESILYARANYVKLFHTINPDKFHDSFQQVKDFDDSTHRNVINTYDIAVQKLTAKDPVSINLLQSCKNLASFSKNFVDQAYPRAIAFKNTSKLGRLSDGYFLEINKIVKFDRSIGNYKVRFISFKQRVKTYKTAVKTYRLRFKAELSKN